ncbi:MAG: Sec-independent protein translocase protein TatB [Stenotrophobium sp.]
MFEISFPEILLCLVIALIVLGPERLPGVARAVGRWTGRARSYMRNLSAELERETQVSELKKQLEDAQRALREHASAGESAMHKIAGDTEDTARKVADGVKDSAGKP